MNIHDAHIFKKLNTYIDINRYKQNLMLVIFTLSILKQSNPKCIRNASSLTMRRV